MALSHSPFAHSALICFAAELLIPNGSFKENETIYDIASIHNVPIELVELKCKKLFLQLQKNLCS